MSYEKTGKVIAILPRRTGQGKNGAWASDSFVIEECNGEQYPKKVMLEVMSTEQRPRWKEMNIQAGEVLKVTFDVDAREWNGRWFNSLNCFKVERVDGQQSNSQPTEMTGTNNQQSETAGTNVQPEWQTGTTPRIEATAQALGANTGQSELPF